MRVLNLNNLNVEQLKELNIISCDIKEDFNTLTENILNSRDKNLAWLLHPLTSRHSYQSDLFTNICYILLAKSTIKENSALEKVVVKNPIQKEILRKDLSTKRIKIISLKRSKSFIYEYLVSIYRVLRAIVRYIRTRNRERLKPLELKKEITLIDTFILQNSIDGGRYIDRYYPGILKDLNKEEKEKIFWIPTLIGKYNKTKLDVIKKNSEEQILYKHDFLKTVDYLRAFYLLLKLPFNKEKAYFIRAVKITKLIQDEFKSKRFHFSTFEGILNFYFVKRLKERGVKVKLLIDWHENQPIDKGLIKGFKTFYPKSYSKGYQGYIISTDYNFYIQPTNYEIESNLIPDEICVVGRGLENRIKKFSQQVKVSTAPAYRFSGVYKKIKEKHIKSIVLLVVLPIGYEDSKGILLTLFDAVNTRKALDFKIKIKSHPLLNINKLKKELKDRWHKDFENIEGHFMEALGDSDIIMGSSSTTLLEALSFGKPVIVTANNNGLTQNPIPSFVTRNMWQLCYDANQVNMAIDVFIAKLQNNANTFIEKGQKIKEKLFEPITNVGTLAFLNIK